LDLIRTFLEHYPFIAFFLTIAIGYLLGSVNVKGFSFGVGAVLFVALFVGYFAPKSAPAPMVGTLGLALFLYSIGIHYGKQFVVGLTSTAGRKANAIAFLGVLSAGIVSLLLMKATDMNLGYALGLFAGAGTSTPTLQAAMVALGNNDPAVGYSVAYPLGVLGPILLLHILFMVLKPKIELSTSADLDRLESAIRNPERHGRSILHVVVSNHVLAGRALEALELPGSRASMIAHVRRGDVEIIPRADLVLDFGDRVGVLAHRDDFATLRAYFGDSMKGTAEVSYVSIMGFLLGAIQLPVHGIGKLEIGLAGVLIAALVLGYLQRTARMNWMLPLSSYLVLRNLGVTLFLAQVGMSSGPQFVATVADTGVVMLALSVVLLAALVLPILIVGLFVFRMPYDEVAGIVAGACGNPAILSYANKLVPTDRPDLGYAMIFPGATILKILFVNIISMLM